VLEAAQAAGSKTQLDAQIGQGSIFDLMGVGGGGGQNTVTRPAHPPVPGEEFDRPTLLALEKESIGLFITEHPLKRVRDALLVKADCACADLPNRKDGEWTKVGGMLTSVRKFRTRSGSQIMRATLDDLEGSVDLLIFEKTFLGREDLLAPDQIVLVRGTVEHGDNGDLIVKVADVERFDPSDRDIEKARVAALKAAEPPAPLHLKLDADRLPASFIEDLKRLFEDYPGESDVVLVMGERKLKLGEGFRVAGRNAALKAELERILGPVAPTPEPVPAAAA